MWVCPGTLTKRGLRERAQRILSEIGIFLEMARCIIGGLGTGLDKNRVGLYCGTCSQR